MMLTIDQVHNIIDETNGVLVVESFGVDENGSLKGKILTDTIPEVDGLEWEVEICPSYPFRTLDTEPIKFVNHLLLDYPHIMEEGNLCMHPADYEDAVTQFAHDLEQLKEWVRRYYVEGEKDEHYEHLVVNHQPIGNEYYTFCFAETTTNFDDEDYGIVNYVMLLDGQRLHKRVRNGLIKEFISHKQFKKHIIPCNISSAFKQLVYYDGVYCLLKEPPAVHGKFIIKRYHELAKLMTQQQIDFIHKFGESHKGDKGFFPLFCGYKIQSGEIHWQAMILFMENLPIEAYRIGIGSHREWHTKFKEGNIAWAQTENVSYNQFFGRGAMDEALSAKKMLIMGIGAVGSMVAETLTRCGAKRITLFDFDEKEPGNVCRSEYHFFTGITEKTAELEGKLIQISPHLECDSLVPLVDCAIKASNDDPAAIQELLNEFDIIFDCTTDNQLMRVLDRAGLSSRIVNLSITNYAQDLVCAISPNVTETIRLVYGLLGRDTETDLYNPTGCWNPTFKASYNDIACKLQYAMKHLMRMLSGHEPIGSFYVSENETNLTINRI